MPTNMTRRACISVFIGRCYWWMPVQLVKVPRGCCRSYTKPKHSSTKRITLTSLSIPHGIGSTSLTSSALDGDLEVRVTDTVVSRKGVGAAESLLLCAKVAPRLFFVPVVNTILMPSKIVGPRKTSVAGLSGARADFIATARPRLPAFEGVWTIGGCNRGTLSIARSGCSAT